MKKTALVLVISTFALLIVLPAISSVNDTTSNTVLMDRTLRADGEPLPPPIPPKLASSGVNLLVADGEPLPPPIPPKLSLNMMFV